MRPTFRIGAKVLALLLVAACGPPPASPSPAPTAASWRQVLVDSSDPDLIVADAAAGERGLIVLGSKPSTAVVWHSTDGTQWMRSQPDAIAALGHAFAPRGVVSLGARVVALGDEQRGSTSSLAIFATLDGTQWSRSTDPTLAVGPFVDAVGIVASEGLFVIDAALPTGGGENPTADVLVLTSTDGANWARHDDKALHSVGGLLNVAIAASNGTILIVQSAPPQGGVELLESTDAAATWRTSRPIELGEALPSDVAIADRSVDLVGCTTAAEGPSHATLWSSSEGPAGPYTATTVDSSSQRSCALAVAIGPRGVVIGGYVGDSPAVWTSADGHSFDLATVENEGSAVKGAVRSVTTNAAFDLAVGDAATTLAGPAVLAPSSVFAWVRAGQP